MLEGNIILFKAALAVFTSLKKEIMAADNFGNFFINLNFK
jgi:hypothetical protein